MSTLEFIAALVDSLVWPVVVLVVFWLLRSSIAGLLDGPVRRWRAGPSGLEIEYWDRAVTHAREELLGTASTDEQKDIRPGSLLGAGFQELAEASPGTAVTEAFGRIERELQVMLVEANEDIPQQLEGAALALLAEEKGLINRQAANAVEGLSVLRNLAAHGRAGDLTAERAREFIALADAVLFTLRQKRQL